MALQFILKDLTAWFGSTIENNSNDLIRVCSFRKMQPTSWFLIRWISRFWKRTSWIWNPKNINPPMQLGPFNFCILVFIKYIYAVFYFWLDNGELKIPRRRRRRPRKRRLKISEVEFFQFYTDYSNFIYFVKCKRTLFEHNSYQPKFKFRKRKKIYASVV